MSATTKVQFTREEAVLLTPRAGMTLEACMELARTLAVEEQRAVILIFGDRMYLARDAEPAHAYSPEEKN